MNNASDLRREYRLASLDEGSANADPFFQFEAWFKQALSADLIEPNAMTVATTGSDGPHARQVLLKGHSKEGFLFFTNYLSAKGHEIATDPRVALLFYWGELERQVRIEGIAKKTSREQSEQYFARRPREAQLGALASNQSSKISRNELEQRFRDLGIAHAGKPIPCPSDWGGYLVVPSSFEFWQGRPNRLHDRLRYEPRAGVWKRFRLAP